MFDTLRSWRPQKKPLTTPLRVATRGLGKGIPASLSKIKSQANCLASAYYTRRSLRRIGSSGIQIS